MLVRPENLPAIIGQRLAVWAIMAKLGATVQDRARGRHNFKMLARDNPKIAFEQSRIFEYFDVLKELTPELAKRGKK
jgi:hypothetical protein